MIKFRDLLNEGHDPFHNRAMGIMSAERGDLAPEVNAHRSKSLHSDLRSAGHKVVPVNGGFVENHGTPEAREVHERSFLVMHKTPGDDNGAVKKTMIHMGKKYGQDSILHKPHNSDIASLHGTNKAFPGVGNVHPVGKYRPRNGDQMFTRMASGREFTFGEALNEDMSGESLSEGGKKMLGYSHEYTDTVGMPRMQPSMQTSSEAKQKPIAHAFHQLASGNPEYKQHVFKAYQTQHPDMVKQSGAHDYDSLAHAAYHAFGHETSKQYDTLSKHVKFDYHGGDKDYANSDAMRHDLHNNNHMDVFNGGETHEHPALSTRGKDGLNGNEKFRAVHDAFGHGVLKNGFGPKGEETAWHVHSQTFSPLAKAAMSTETRGQNSWVNYSGVNKGRDPKQTVFAKQKVGLLPPEMNHSDYNGEVPHYLKKHMNTSITESNYPVLEVRESEKMKVRPEHEEDDHYSGHTKAVDGTERSLRGHYDYNEEHGKALNSYSDQSRDINHHLWQKSKFRAGHDIPEKHQKTIDHMDSAIAAHKTPAAMTVYSGTRHDPRDKGELHHPAFLSTSLDPKRGQFFAAMHRDYHGNNHVLKINVPKGHNGAFVGHVAEHPSEREFILPRDSKLKHIKTESTKYGSSVLHEHHMDLVQ